jgi:hypothetical protein
MTTLLSPSRACNPSSIRSQLKQRNAHRRSPSLHRLYSQSLCFSESCCSVLTVLRVEAHTQMRLRALNNQQLTQVIVECAAPATRSPARPIILIDSVICCVYLSVL